jgi:hypothetical protein
MDQDVQKESDLQPSKDTLREEQVGDFHLHLILLNS